MIILSAPCPKCGYQRKSTDAGADGECPSCGVFHEKYLQWLARRELAAQSAGSVPVVERQPFGRFLWDALWHTPDRVDRTAFAGRCAALAGVVIWGAWFILQPWASDTIGQSFLHRVNLPFHEFGHIFFRPFGEWMMYLGGSLFQCLLPLMLAAYFVLRQGQPFSAAICLWWCGQNFIDVAPYIGDARALALPLIGEWSDDAVQARAFRHDWHNILGAMGWLERDRALAVTAKIVGAATMLLSWLWGTVLLRAQYRNLDGDVFNEQ